MRSLILAARRSRFFVLMLRLTQPLRQRFQLGYVYHFDLRGPVPEFRAAAPVEVVRASRAEVEEAASLGGPWLRDAFLARLDSGMACYVAKLEGRVVAYNWTQYESGDDEGDLIALRPGEIYTTDAFTVEEWRGRRIHTETLAVMLQAAKEQGYRDAYTLANAFKPGSRKTHDRLGWRLSGRVLRIETAGGWLRPVTLTGSPHPLSRTKPPSATAP